MQTAAELNNLFAIPDVLSFEEMPGGLAYARITSERCAATLFLHGAHLVHWQPEGQEPVFFLSEKSRFTTESSIRGGVPVIFPWFGARQGERTDGPQHGFARTSTWELVFAAIADGDVHLTLVLAPNETSRALGYDDFRVAYEVVLGHTLTMRLSVANEAEKPLHFEEALHSYFAVGDAEQLQVTGLEEVEYLDKTEAFARKTQGSDAITLHGETDRIFLNTPATVGIHDPASRRQIAIAKRSSMNTVVWNPWVELTAQLSDLPADGWKKFICVETANVRENAVTVQNGEAHVMEAHIFLVDPEEKAG